MATDSYFKVDTGGIEKMQKMLNNLPNAIPVVTSRALNLAIHKMYTAAGKLVADDYFIKKGKFSKSLTMILANNSHLGAALVGVGKDIPLGRFKISPPSPQPAKRPVITAQIAKNQGSIPVPGAFVATMKSGYKGVFKRTGSKRFPLVQPPSGVSAASMLADKTIREPVTEEGRKNFQSEFERLMKVEVEKNG